MVLYTRHQLLVLLALVATFGGGLAVDRWRRSHPDVAERLERFDRADAPDPPSPAAPPTSGPAGPAPKLRADRDAGETPPIDLNRATADELARLPGVGRALAARIVEAREAEPFGAVDDLRRVRGVGPAKLDRMRPFVTVK
jgi:competence ComEA-like helix-hairpin-helix protein